MWHWFHMIVVRVELHSAVTSKVTELARIHIANDGTHMNPRYGNYLAHVFRGRSKEQLDRHTLLKSAVIVNHPRKQQHVWNLVAKVLSTMRYGNAK